MIFPLKLTFSEGSPIASLITEGLLVSHKTCSFRSPIEAADQMLQQGSQSTIRLAAAHGVSAARARHDELHLLNRGRTIQYDTICIIVCDIKVYIP
jgi:hypothetical protein